MCIVFDSKDGSAKITETSIVVAVDWKEKEVTMTYTNSSSEAMTMVLPLFKRRTGKLMITSDTTPEMLAFNETLRNAFAGLRRPVMRSRSATLEVRRIGAYDVSVAECSADLVGKLDRSAFVIADDTLSKITARYEAARLDDEVVMYVVCVLRDESSGTAPLVMKYPFADRILIPTYHGPGGHSGRGADWDHIIYIETPNESAVPQIHTSTPNRPSRSVRSISPFGPNDPIFHSDVVCAYKVGGQAPNDDIVLYTTGTAIWLNMATKLKKEIDLDPTIEIVGVKEHPRGTKTRWLEFGSN